MNPVHRIGVAGTGFIGRGFVLAVEGQPDLAVSKILTRRPIGPGGGFSRPDLLTHSLAEMIDESDLVLECSGDPVHAAVVIDGVLAAGLPVVTLDAEFHVTAGSFFAGRGVLTEAEGDQPGNLAALCDEAAQMGFRPLVYGNVKGFHNETPTPEDMHYWSQKQGISRSIVTSSTDGTKVQVEQALVANGLGGGIAVPGLRGLETDDLDAAAAALGAEARQLGYAISDYVLSPKLRVREFIVAEHDAVHHAALKYLKMGEGPFYVLAQTSNFAYLEIAKTIRRVLGGGGVLLNNGATPTISVAAIAKKPLAPGCVIRQGLGSFEVRGIAVRIRENAGHVPIGLLADAVITRPVMTGQQLSFDDVELPDSLALRAWRETERRALPPLFSPPSPTAESPDDVPSLSATGGCKGAPATP